MLTTCAGDVCAVISSVTCEPIDTLGSEIAAPPLSIVTFWLEPLPLVVHQPAVAPVNPRLEHAFVVLVIDTALVGGIGLGAGGVGYVTDAGSCTMLPVTSACPVSVSALTAFALQLPTPVRGV